jgi:hypothetical protein
MKQHKRGQEKLRAKIMKMVKQGLKTLKAASLELGISYSQGKRIYQRYLKEETKHWYMAMSANRPTTKPKKQSYPKRYNYIATGMAISGRHWRRKCLKRKTAWQ